MQSIYFFVRQDLQDNLDFFLSFHLPAIGFAFPVPTRNGAGQARRAGTKLRKTNPLAAEGTLPLTPNGDQQGVRLLSEGQMTFSPFHQERAKKIPIIQ